MIFSRLTLLGTFGAAGVALAICFGLSPEEPQGGRATRQRAQWSLVAPSPNHVDSEPAAVDAPTTAEPQPPDTVPPAGSASALAQLPEITPPPTPVLVEPLPAHTYQVTQPQADDRLLKVIEYLADRLRAEPAAPLPTAAEPAPETEPLPLPEEPPAAEAPLPPVPPSPEISRPDPAAGDGRLRMQFSGSDIREVLDALAAAGDLNILASNSVQGTVSATLNNVDIDSALGAILNSTGFIARREGNFIYVGTPQDFESLEQSLDTIGTRVYRPNYVTAVELQALVQPLLTPAVGVVGVSSPSEQGIASDGTNAGGDDFAGSDVVLVRDYEAVLAQVDQVVCEIDTRPLQVAIEAMILSVKLSDGFEFGVDFELLRNKEHVRLGWGDPLDSLSKFAFGSGLKFAFLDDSLGAFLNALETIGDTNVIATPRLMVLNKHRAEILIGEELGYISTTITETSSSQSVEFLEVGAQLRLRPYISSDGLIRMEVHPELSSGSVEVQNNFTLPNKETTQVTTNIMVRDGCTVVIGGLMREELKTTASQVPFFGSLPLVGVAFRNKNEEIERREIMVLITPHIVYEPDTCEEGDTAAAEFHRRQATYAEKMSPLGKRSVARSYFRKAQQAWAAGDRRAAMRFAELAVHFDPLNRAAIDLRSTIWLGEAEGEHTLDGPPLVAVEPPLDGGGQIAPWVLDDLERLPAAAPPLPQHPLDPGVPGRKHDVERPRKLQ